MDHVIIDGYNLIHAIPALKKTLAHHADSARELLIHSVAQLTHKRKFRCTIIFDGDLKTSGQKNSLHAPVHVVYSHPVTADERIKEMIERSNNRRQLIIITSDRELHRFAAAHSCQIHSSSHFANLLKAEDDSVTEKSDAPLTKGQIDEWLKIFGEK